jgi:predicted O-methyltransferase YrrM
MNARFRAAAYLEYLRRSTTRFRIHSPFVYSFIENVLRNKDSAKEPGKLFSLRKKLMDDSTLISKTDLGSGSEKGNTYQVPLGKLIRTSISSERELGLLYNLAKYFRPGLTVELGTAAGLSAAALALGHPEGKVITVEGSPSLVLLAEKNLKNLKINNVKTVLANFDDALPGLLPAVKEVDLYFIDGNHRYEPTVNYFELGLEHSSNDTVFVFDDIYWSPDMSEAWKAIKNRPEVRISIDIFGKGFIFLKKELSIQHFVLRY